MKTNNMDQQSPAWLLESAMDEVVFSSEFLQSFPMKSVNGRFFTPDRRIYDENQLRKMICDLIKPYISNNLMKRVSSLAEVLRLGCCTENLPLHMDRIHVANGTLFLDGTFTEKKEFCQNHLPVFYDPAGHTHIPPRVFKEFTNLQAQRTELDELLQGVGPFNAKRRIERTGKLQSTKTKGLFCNRPFAFGGARDSNPSKCGTPVGFRFRASPPGTP